MIGQIEQNANQQINMKVRKNSAVISGVKKNNKTDRRRSLKLK